MSEKWTPATWRSRPIEQAPVYPDLDALAAVEARLATYPPLVFAGEARKLKARFPSAQPWRLPNYVPAMVCSTPLGKWLGAVPRTWAAEPR